jgi:hypothetical protein
MSDSKYPPRVLPRPDLEPGGIPGALAEARTQDTRYLTDTAEALEAGPQPETGQPIPDEVARLTRLLKDTRYEMEALREKRRREHLILGHLAGLLKASSDSGHRVIGNQIEEVITEKPGHPDDLKAAA